MQRKAKVFVIFNGTEYESVINLIGKSLTLQKLKNFAKFKKEQKEQKEKELRDKEERERQDKELQQQEQDNKIYDIPE